MGNLFEFNWILKLSPSQGLNESQLRLDRVYAFSKEGYRIYPVEFPIDLVNGSWEAIGRAVISSLTWKQNTTSGTYSILRLYHGAERRLRTEGWRETLRSVVDCSDLDSYEGMQITKRPRAQQEDGHGP